MVVKFHLTDKCNLNCRGCHWFSSDVRVAEEIGWEHYINWIRENQSKINGIRLTGGEPTLYKDFLMLVNNLPQDIPLVINTNGTNIDILKQIKRRNNIQLWVSENRKVTKDFEKKIQALGFDCSFHSFNGAGREKNLANEVEFGLNSSLIGKKGWCVPNNVRFAADGWAYNCENGLRGKNENLRCDFSLWNGQMNISGKFCEISKACASCFCKENKMISNFAMKTKLYKLQAIKSYIAKVYSVLRTFNRGKK
jgi:hypothetical protein